MTHSTPPAGRQNVNVVHIFQQKKAAGRRKAARQDTGPQADQAPR